MKVWLVKGSYLLLRDFGEERPCPTHTASPAARLEARGRGERPPCGGENGVFSPESPKDSRGAEHRGYLEQG